MKGTPEESMQRIVIQDQVIKEQQESIGEIKVPKLLIKKPKKLGPFSIKIGSSHSTPKKPSRGKRNDEPFSSETREGKSHLNIPSRSSSERSNRSEPESDPHVVMMESFQSQLNALTHRKDLQAMGVVSPYPLEWKTIPFPPKFIILELI